MQIREKVGKCKILSVAGTSYRESEIRAAMEKRGGIASLVPEPDNAHDSEAVKVVVNGQHVGYIPRSNRVPFTTPIHLCKMGADPPHVWIAVQDL